MGTERLPVQTGAARFGETVGKTDSAKAAGQDAV